MSDASIPEALTGAVENADQQVIDDNLSLDALVLFINSERLKHLQEQTHDNLKSLKERQQKVADLHKLMQAINKASKSDGQIDLSDNQDLKNLLEEAKEQGVDIDLNKEKYNADERDRLVENIRMKVDDLNVQNDMQLQSISRLTNERYESYQMARGILKPLHEAKMTHAKNIGR